SLGEANVGEFTAKYPGTLGNGIEVSLADANVYSSWAYATLFQGAPNTSDYVENLGGSQDELHAILIDTTGQISGVAGTILEKYQFLSKARDAKKADGASNYYKDVINNQSKYVWWTDHPTEGTNWGNTASSTNFGNL